MALAATRPASATAARQASRVPADVGAGEGRAIVVQEGAGLLGVGRHGGEAAQQARPEGHGQGLVVTDARERGEQTQGEAAGHVHRERRPGEAAAVGEGIAEQVAEHRADGPTGGHREAQPDGRSDRRSDGGLQETLLRHAPGLVCWFHELGGAPCPWRKNSPRNQFWNSR